MLLHAEINENDIIMRNSHYD